jgi:hypothetical protein
VPGEALIALVAEVAASNITRKIVANNAVRYRILLLIFPSSGPDEEADPFLGK